MLRSFNPWGRVLACAAALALSSAAYTQKEIVFGLQCDRTGPTQTVGVFLCPGYHDYIALVNSKGGINGKRVKLLSMDYAYKMPEALNLYKKFKDQDKVVAIQGWGSGDTEALKEQVAKDQMPYWSAS